MKLMYYMLYDIVKVLNIDYLFVWTCAPLVRLMCRNLPSVYTNKSSIAEARFIHYDLIISERLKHYYFFQKKNLRFWLFFIIFVHKIMKFSLLITIQFIPFLFNYWFWWFFGLKSIKFTPYFRVISMCVSLLVFVC